jgi:hypothetical protein
MGTMKFCDKKSNIYLVICCCFFIGMKPMRKICEYKCVMKKLLKRIITVYEMKKINFEYYKFSYATDTKHIPEKNSFKFDYTLNHFSKDFPWSGEVQYSVQTVTYSRVVYIFLYNRRCDQFSRKTFVGDLLN